MSVNGPGRLNWPPGPLGNAGVQDVVLHRRALLGLVGVGLLLGLDVDRGAVVGGADACRTGRRGCCWCRPRRARPRPSSPSTAATANLTDSTVSLLFSTTVLPSASTSLPPHDHRIRIPPARRVAEGVPGGLADTAGPSAFSFLPAARNSSQVVGELVVSRPRRTTTCDRRSSPPPTHHGTPIHLLPTVRDHLADVVIAALRLADLLGDVADIGEALGIELRPVVERHDDVGAGAGLDRRGDARLDVVGVDGLDLELDAERLLAFLRDLRP